MASRYSRVVCVSCWPLWSGDWLEAAAAQPGEKTIPYITSPRKDPNSKHKVWFPLNTYSFHTTVQLKDCKLKHGNRGPSVQVARLPSPSPSNLEVAFKARFSPEGYSCWCVWISSLDYFLQGRSLDSFHQSKQIHIYNGSVYWKIPCCIIPGSWWPLLSMASSSLVLLGASAPIPHPQTIVPVKNGVIEEVSKTFST